MTSLLVPSRPSRLTVWPVMVALVSMGAMAGRTSAQGPFTVTTTADSGAGSLRQAIDDANAGSGGAIRFDIPAADAGFNLPGSPGAWRISLATPLPALNRAIVLSGLTQPGATCAAPKIELRPAAPTVTTGVQVTANNCEVRGLVVNGFTGEGVALRTVTGCIVSCNFVGTDVTGLVPLGNGVGVSIFNGANNTVGGAAPNTGNLIAGNTGIGVSVTASPPPSNVGNPILRNSIRGNGALGIDLGANGVTANDHLDLDTGPNHYQNYPVVTGYDGATIAASLASLPNRRFRIEFFANTAQDPTGFGEGGVFIDSVEVLSNSGGLVNTSLPYVLVPAVRFITATATALPPLRDSDPAPGEGGGGPDGIGPRGIAPAAPTGTSEFSQAFLVGPMGGNTPPIARDDAYATTEDVPLAVTLPAMGVLGNDSDPEGSPITALLISGTSRGVLNLSANGTFSYIPNANFAGVDTFTYRAFDGTDPSNIATVRITVQPVNDAPFAINDEYATSEDTPLIVATRAEGVLGNDIDAEADPLTAIRLTNVTSGSLTLNPDGTLTYTPSPNFNGSDSFTYKANDGQFDSGPATVSITITPVNDPPTAVDDAYTTGFNTTLAVTTPGAGLLANDTDPDNDPLTASIVTPPAPTSGTVSLNPNGTFSFTPANGFSGIATFTYRARDAAADSAPATVRITVRGNTPPTAANDAYTTAEDTPLTVSSVALGVLGNDTDPEAPPQVLTATLVTTTTRGTLTFSPNGTFNYNPQPNLNGPDSFTYRVSDGFANSNVATATINVLPVNDPPVARNDSYLTNEDTALTVAPPGVLINDGDVDDDVNTLTVTITTGPASGSLTNVAAGGFRYTPNLNFNGSDTFRYRLTDPAGAQSSIATVSITVLPLNDPPTAVADMYATDEDTPLTIAAPGVLSNDTDPDSPAASLTAQLVTPPPPASTASFALNANGSFSFTPASNFFGSVAFTYRASDGAAASDPATVTIVVRPVNDAPVAANDTYSTPFNTPLSIAAAQGVLSNDTDVDGSVSALTAMSASTTSHGLLSLNSNGSFSYTPTTDYTGPDSFTYRAFDGSLTSNLATVSITVGTAANQPPVARCRDVTIDARSACPPPERFFITPADVNNGSTDPDDPTDSLVLTVSNTGPFRLGAATVTLTVTDPHGASSTCTATVAVLGDDCNRNGIPDSCDISGGMADCNRDGVLDECQCLWDNGMAAAGGVNGGRLSQIGGRVQVTSKVADDFYLEPGHVYRITSFSGQALTTLAPALRNARVEFFDDCNGTPPPSGRALAAFSAATITASEPADGGFSLVTYTFDLCNANLWLDGGKVYWVSLTSTVPCGNSAESFWAFGSREVMCSIPRVARGRPSPYLCTDINFDPWLPADTALGLSGGCKNMAFKLGGASCPIIWDNGPYKHCPGGGGLASGQSGRLAARAADNFVVKPCDDQRVCLIDATIWTDCNPATGFIEIYANECKSPASRLFAAPVSRVVNLHETIRIGTIDVHAYQLRVYGVDWTLQAGRTYWLSAGAACGGLINGRSYFATADRCETNCAFQISPAWMGNVGVSGVAWCPMAQDLSFRIAATPGVRLPRIVAVGGSPECPVDVNGDGVAGVQDLLTFLSAWFSGCP